MNHLATFKSQNYINVQDFNAALDGFTDDSSALFRANATAIENNCPIFISGVLHINSQVTINAPIVDTTQKIFSSNSKVTIDNGLPVRPDWWGDIQNSINYATNSLPSSGGTVILLNKTYKPNNHIYGFDNPESSVFFSKDNVSYIGEKMPSLSNDCTSLIDGSIIQGQCIAYANNIKFQNIGFDSGLTVMNNYFQGKAFPGISGEGLLLTYPDNHKKNSGTLRKNARLHNVIGLCMNPSVPTHALIIGEGYENIECTGEVKGFYGIYGITIKCSKVKSDNISSFCNGFSGIIIKSDSKSNKELNNIYIKNIFADAYGPEGCKPHSIPNGRYGILFFSDTQKINGIEIENAKIFNQTNSIGFIGESNISNIKIGSLIQKKPSRTT
ncbi:MAG: hypothetical protein ACMV0H_10070 [Aquaspirillum sp.]